MILRLLTLFPESFGGYLQSSILGKALETGKLKVEVTDIRDYAGDKHRTCDDNTYGGGPGMILKPEPLAQAIEAINNGESKRIIYLTPSGQMYNQAFAEELSQENEIILICGRYEGIDQRIIDSYVTDEISVGDYILSSGETAAKIIIDSVSRLLDGVINHESLEEESFSSGLLEYPQYTRPQDFRGMKVPEILLSGHHENIRKWRLKKSLLKTLEIRPDLFNKILLSKEEKKLLEEILTEEDV